MNVFNFLRPKAKLSGKTIMKSILNINEINEVNEENAEIEFAHLFGFLANFAQAERTKEYK